MVGSQKLRSEIKLASGPQLWRLNQQGLLLLADDEQLETISAAVASARLQRALRDNYRVTARSRARAAPFRVDPTAQGDTQPAYPEPELDDGLANGSWRALRATSKAYGFGATRRRAGRLGWA